MKAGDLNTLIQFRRLTDDGWVAYGAPHFAARRDVESSEDLNAGEVQAKLTARFTVRYSSFTTSITPRDRLVCDGQEFEIVGIIEVGPRRRWLRITGVIRQDKA